MFHLFSSKFYKDIVIDLGFVCAEIFVTALYITHFLSLQIETLRKHI